MDLQRSLLGFVILVGCADVAPDQDLLQLQAADGGTPTASGTVSTLDASIGIVPPCGTTSPDASISPPGGGCTYVTSVGTAVIEQIESVDAELSSCEQDPVRVRFRYLPDEGDAAPHGFTDPRTGTFTLPGGMAPPRSCITGAGIQVDSRIRVQRKSLVSGTCSPVVFTFDEALVADCTRQCGDSR